MSAENHRRMASFAGRYGLVGAAGAALAFCGALSLKSSNAFSVARNSALDAWISIGTGDMRAANSDAETVQSMLQILGVDADTLAAAGVDAAGLVGVLDDADAWFGEFGTGALHAQVSIAGSSARCSEIRRALRRGESTYAPADLTTAIQALATAQSSWDQHLTSLWTAISDNLGEQAEVQIRAMNSAAKWAIPIPSRTSSLTEAQWLALERAECF